MVLCLSRSQHAVVLVIGTGAAGLRAAIDDSAGGAEVETVGKLLE